MKNYKSYIGSNYDLMSATQFNLLTLLGLREHHYLLDIGCGSLRVGKLFIPYLLQGRYCGIEPNRQLLFDGIEYEIGYDMKGRKMPYFDFNSDFNCSVFNRKFDFILAQSIFSHASQDQIRKCLLEAKKVMKPESIFVATFVEGLQNYTGKKWVYPGTICYTMKHMMNLIEEQGLICQRFCYPHPNMQTWLLITLYGVSSINIPDIEKTMLLAKEVNYCKNRLMKLQNHPYVRLGLFLQRIFRLRRY